jgi:hypothetical protein
MLQVGATDGRTDGYGLLIYILVCYSDLEMNFASGKTYLHAVVPVAFAVRVTVRKFQSII